MEKTVVIIVILLIVVFALEIVLGVISIVFSKRLNDISDIVWSQCLNDDSQYWSKLGMVVLNDQIIPNVPIVLYANSQGPGYYEVIPLLAFMRAAGFEITWIDESHAHITGYGNVYDLDMNAEPRGFALIQHRAESDEDSEGEGLLFSLPGSSVYTCIPVEKDFLIDSGTLRYILWRAGLSPQISSDFKSGILYVTVTYPST